MHNPSLRPQCILALQPPDKLGTAGGRLHRGGSIGRAAAHVPPDAWALSYGAFPQVLVSCPLSVSLLYAHLLLFPAPLPAKPCRLHACLPAWACLAGKVLAFHGTHMENLHAILHHGLRVGSGTRLERTGRPALG